MKKSVLLILGVPGLLFAQFTDIKIQKQNSSTSGGMVVSAHPLASEAGAEILRKGGNAFDAAIAVQYALAVVYPQAGNIGGGGFMVATKANGEKLALDFRETAPAAAHRDMYLDDSGNANTDLSQNGSLAVGIPGTVAGLFATHRYANLPMAELLQPAIDLAEKGISLTVHEADLLNEHAADFAKFNRCQTAFQKNRTWYPGDILKQPELAQTLRRIQQDGLAGFYSGKTADLIVQEMKRSGGIITAEDLKNYKVRERTPLEIPYRGYQIVTMPLPSSGGILLSQMLQMSEMAGLQHYAQNSTEAVQIMVEAERRAVADRAADMGDPAVITDETKKLTSREYVRNRWSSFSFKKATPSADVGDIIQPVTESAETTHISITDRFGNAVAVTTTLNGLYGSRVVVRGAGFLLNNEMDDFSIKPGVPNMFGAVGGEANAIQPGKRMLSSMTPTVVLKNEKPFMVVGTPGGTTIPTSVYQTIVNVIDFKLSPAAAVNAPKFHHQWLPETVSVEKRFPKSVRQKLEDKNYTVTERGNIGRTELILMKEDGVIGIADWRGDDSAAAE